MRTLTVLSAFWLAIANISVAQDAPTPIDGIQHIFHDDLLDQMNGAWQLTGTIQGRAAHHTVAARWILNHQFLEIHERDTAEPAKSESAYEAIALIGYDHMSERYVLHWNDVFGARFSETLGYGARSGNEIAFIFEYPDGPFRTVFRWLPDQKQWEWLMRAKNPRGQWEEFGRMTLAP